MLRLFDYACRLCGYEAEYLVEDGAPSTHDTCKICLRKGWLDRRLSLPAPYTGERVLNPMIRGGTHDTCGFERPPPMPALPGEAYTKTDKGTHVNRDALLDRRNSKEYQEWSKARSAVVKRNEAKRQRAKLIEQGAPINMRRDKLPGDPKVTA